MQKILLQLQSDGKMKEAMKKVARLGYLLFYLAKVQKVHQHHIKKGSQFACSGELSSNQYQDEDGNTRTMLTVIVSKFYWLGKKDKDDNGTQNQQVPPKEPNIDYQNTNIDEETQVF